MQSESKLKSIEKLEEESNAGDVTAYVIIHFILNSLSYGCSCLVFRFQVSGILWRTGDRLCGRLSECSMDAVSRM